MNGGSHVSQWALQSELSVSSRTFSVNSIIKHCHLRSGSVPPFALLSPSSHTMTFGVTPARATRMRSTSKQRIVETTSTRLAWPRKAELGVPQAAGRLQCLLEGSRSFQRAWGRALGLVPPASLVQVVGVRVE